MATWADGLEWNPDILQEQAGTTRRSAQIVTDSRQGAMSVRPPLWLGKAADLAHAAFILVLFRMKQQENMLRYIADITDHAAKELRAIQEDMVHITTYTSAHGFVILDHGLVIEKGPANTKWDATRYLVLARIYNDIITICGRLTGMDISYSTGLALGKAASTEADLHANLIDEIHTQTSNTAAALLNALHTKYASQSSDLDPFAAGLERFIDSEATIPRWLDDLLYNGQLPQIAELAAQAIYLAGTFSTTAPSPTDLHTFDDGTPHAPRLLSSDGTKQINSVADLIDSDKLIYDNTNDKHGHYYRPTVQVIAVGNPPRFTVVIPGTTFPPLEPQGWMGHQAGTDWPANFKGIGYGDSSATESAKAAIDAAIAQWETDNNTTVNHPEVLLTGHSQGGIIAANIASDPLFTHRYHVGAVVTFGSPINTIPVNPSVPVTNYS